VRPVVRADGEMYAPPARRRLCTALRSSSSSAGRDSSDCICLLGGMPAAIMACFDLSGVSPVAESISLSALSLCVINGAALGEGRPAALTRCTGLVGAVPRA
jgi:hypothetical protein